MRIFSWLFLATLSLVLLVQLTVLGAPLRGPEAPAGIISFELAFATERADAIVHAWRNAGVLETARVSLGLDVVFLLVYPPFLALSVGLLRTVEQRHAASSFGDLGRPLMWLVLCCAPLDGLENYLLWQTLAQGPTPTRALLAGTAATIKFLLVATAGLWCLIAVARFARRLSRRATR
ncbi:MAG TPA: hypothetical protein DGD08_17680 [Gemmatimonas aurantiaca]|uniref:DUF4328 domain-containing protein n=2 Tax=Gemmatimonas aurantiaca TaxID=173480 RepID=A0A3D4VD69_9BACT|nr:hypothetical protein [Gemmatimonas aurantiaca]BAH40870.1 hypothetical membrane protein [Gemmatimonas aurantiaca T-27]HCT59035.1 hypothetical protein [Gemmatimonas aurantiaca]